MTDERPWLMKPGECLDRYGVPIYPGDLLRTPHFRDRRRRQHWLYHTVVSDTVHGETALRMVPTSHLEPTRRAAGGSCLLSQDIVAGSEVISGYGPKPFLDYTDRPKTNLPANAAGVSDER